MTEQPNIKKEILQHVVEKGLGNGPYDMKEFAIQSGYEPVRVYKKIDELYPLLEYGVGPVAPWVGYEQEEALKEQLKEWSDHNVTDFDSEAFLDWLEDQEGTIAGSTLTEEWPYFPYEHMTGVTVSMKDGESQYFQSDLRRAARKKQPLD